MTRTIADLMQRHVRCIGMDDTVADIERRFVRERLSWAPVVQDGSAAMGVISATDLLQFHALKGDPDTVRAWQLCTYKPLTVPPDTPLESVARAMADSGVHHVVVAEPGRPIAGVVSSLDFVKTFTQR